MTQFWPIRHKLQSAGGGWDSRDVLAILFFPALNAEVMSEAATAKMHEDTNPQNKKPEQNAQGPGTHLMASPHSWASSRPTVTSGTRKTETLPCLSQVRQPSVLEAGHIPNFNMLDKRVEEKPEERREGKKRCHSQSALRRVLGKCPNGAPG